MHFTVRPDRVFRALQWRYNGCIVISKHQPQDCLLNLYSGADQRKHQSSASLAFLWGIHRWPLNFPHKGPVMWKMFPFDDVIMFSSLAPGICGCRFKSVIFIWWTDIFTTSFVRYMPQNSTDHISQPGHQQPWYWETRNCRKCKYIYLCFFKTI